MGLDGQQGVRVSPTLQTYLNQDKSELAQNNLLVAFRNDVTCKSISASLPISCRCETRCDRVKFSCNSRAQTKARAKTPDSMTGLFWRMPELCVALSLT